MLISVLSQKMDEVRKQFSNDEQKMLIDIFNGTMLTPSLMGQHIDIEVEDSFELYPGMYEEKWGVNKEEMLEKIKSLSPLSAALVELWAVGFWDINRDAGDLEAYIHGKINIDIRLREMAENLQTASEILEKTKSALIRG